MQTRRGGPADVVSPCHWSGFDPGSTIFKLLQVPGPTEAGLSSDLVPPPRNGAQQDSEEESSEVADREAKAGMQKRPWEEREAVVGGPKECLDPVLDIPSAVSVMSHALGDSFPSTADMFMK